MSKRKREFQPTHEPQLKHYIPESPQGEIDDQDVLKPESLAGYISAVDSFVTMLAASRAQTQSQASSAGD